MHPYHSYHVGLQEELSQFFQVYLIAPKHVEFADASPETIFRASNVNCHAQAILSNYFLRKLTARGPARSALVSVGTNAAEPQNPR